MASEQKLTIPSEPSGQKRGEFAAKRKVGWFGTGISGEKFSRRGAETQRGCPQMLQMDADYGPSKELASSSLNLDYCTAGNIKIASNTTPTNNPTASPMRTLPTNSPMIAKGAATNARQQTKEIARGMVG